MNEQTSKNRNVKAFILILTLLYFVSPFDAMPGVIIDDIFVAVLGVIANSKL